MGRKPKDDSLKDKSKMITAEQVEEDYKKFCASVGHRESIKVYPPPDMWICEDRLFTYIYDPSKKEYINYIKGVGVFEFNTLFQKFCIDLTKTDTSDYVRALLRTANKVTNKEITPQEALGEFEKLERKADASILI